MFRRRRRISRSRRRTRRSRRRSRRSRRRRRSSRSGRSRRRRRSSRSGRSRRRRRISRSIRSSRSSRSIWTVVALKPPRFAQRGERQREGAASDGEHELHDTGRERNRSFEDPFCERAFCRSRRRRRLRRLLLEEVARCESALHFAVFAEPHEEVERLGEPFENAA